MSNDRHRNYEPVSPVDTDLSQHHPEDEKEIRPTVRPRRSSSSSLSRSIKTPRAARFAEATSVNSPIGPTTTGRSPFADPPIQTTYLMPQPQPSDVGFGYVSDNQASRHASFAGVEVPLTPSSPLKSALKPPGTPARYANPLSPTFREEQILEKEEEKTEKQNAADLVIEPFLGARPNINMPTESENSSPSGQDGSSRSELQLQSDRFVDAFSDIFHIQCLQISSLAEQCHTVGPPSTKVAANYFALDCVCLARHVDFHHLRVLERRSSAG